MHFFLKIYNWRVQKCYEEYLLMVLKPISIFYTSKAMICHFMCLHLIDVGNEYAKELKY